MALLFGFVLGCALIVSVLHAYYRDVAPVLTAALLPWFFLTPIFYEPDASIPFVARHPAVATLLDWANPIAPFIHGLRAVLYYGAAPDAGRLLYMTAVPRSCLSRPGCRCCCAGAMPRLCMRPTASCRSSGPVRVW